MLKKVELLSLLCALGYLYILSVASSDSVNAPEHFDDESKFQENVDLDQEESENEYPENLPEPEYSEEVTSSQRSGIEQMCNGRRCAKGSRCIRRCKPICVTRKSHEGRCDPYGTPCGKGSICCDKEGQSGYCDTKSAFEQEWKCSGCYKFGEKCVDTAENKQGCCQNSSLYNNACTKQSDGSLKCSAGTCTVTGQPCKDEGYPCCDSKRTNYASSCINGKCQECILVGSGCKKGVKNCCSADKKSTKGCPYATQICK